MIQTLKEKLVSKQQEIGAKDSKIENLSGDLGISKNIVVKMEREVKYSRFI